MQPALGRGLPTAPLPGPGAARRKRRAPLGRPLRDAPHAACAYPQPCPSLTPYAEVAAIGLLGCCGSGAGACSAALDWAAPPAAGLPPRDTIFRPQLNMIIWIWRPPVISGEHLQHLVGRGAAQRGAASRGVQFVVGSFFSSGGWGGRSGCTGICGAAGALQSVQLAAKRTGRSHAGPTQFSRLSLSLPRTPPAGGGSTAARSAHLATAAAPFAAARCRKAA